MKGIAAKGAEVANNTPFDNYEANLNIQLIERSFQELSRLIQNTPEITQEYVENAIKPILDGIENLSDDMQEIKKLLAPKTKIKKDTLPLRDPVSKDLLISKGS